MKRYYRLITVALSFLLLYVLVRQIQFGDIRTLLSQTRLSYLFAAFGMYLVMTLFRAYRFWDLTLRAVRFRDMCVLTAAHAFVNSIMPARTGELAYVYYVKKTNRVGLGANIASLFIARVFDTLIAIVGMLVSIFFVAQGLQDTAQMLFLAVAAFIVVFAFALLFFFWEAKVLWLMDFFFELLRLKRYAFGNRILLKLNDIVRMVAAAREPRLFLRTLLSTTLVWTAIYFFLWFIALGLGLTIGFWQSVFVASLPTLASTLPFYTIGNFGLFEGAKTLALTLLGFAKELAISFSFLSHIAEILMFAIPGIPAYIWIALRWSDAKTEATPAP